ncbi:MAG TPA: hypothetical protein VN956_26550 [Pyrinomonadaceae bacterium]|nr:hypothetical protein [Pyrinomonadaceae bacterium]
MNGYFGSSKKEKEANHEYRTIAVQWLDIYQRPATVDPKLSFVQSLPLREGVSEIEGFADHGMLMNYPDVVEILQPRATVPIAGAHMPPEHLKALLKRIRLVARSKFHDSIPRVPPKEKNPRTPWATGTFYLACIVVVGVLFLVIARTVSPIVLPIVLLASLLAVSIVGALQLRNDKRLSEKNFIELMSVAMKSLPLLGRDSSRDKVIENQRRRVRIIPRNCR